MNNKAIPDLSSLTIAVPTYNRIEKCSSLIVSLANLFVHTRCRIEMYDNCSDDPELKLRSVCYSNKVKYVRRDVNLGPIASISRIYEECTTPYLMILCDDDYVDNELVESLVSEISFLSANPKFAAVKMQSSLSFLDSSVSFDSLDQFSRHNSSRSAFGSTLLVSSWLWVVGSVKPYLRYGYLYSSSQASHVITAMASMYYGNNSIRYSVRQGPLYSKPDKGDCWDPVLTYNLMIQVIPFINFLSRSQVKMFLNGCCGTKAREILSLCARLVLAKRSFFDGLPLVALSVLSPKHFILIVTLLIFQPFAMLLPLSRLRVPDRHRLVKRM